MNNEILQAARRCGVPDLSINPEGELMTWVIAFYREAYNSAIEDAAEKASRFWIAQEDSNDCSAYAAIYTLEMKP